MKTFNSVSKKVLYITYDGLTDPLGQSQILPYIMGLTEYGYEFTMLSCEKPERLVYAKEKINNLISGYPIHWVPLLYHKNPPVISSIYDYRNILRTAIALQKQENFLLVHTRPGLPPLVALQLKKRYDIKFVNDIRGFWADERVDGKLWNLKSPFYKIIYRFFKKKESQSLQVNDYTTCLTHSAKREITKWNILEDASKIEVIPCSVDLELFNPEKISVFDKDELRQQLNISPDDFVISYLGSVGTWYMMDEMFHFVKMLQNKKKKIKFLVITPADNHSKISEFAINFQINKENIIIRELERKKVPLYLSICHYSIFFIKPCYSKLSSSPTKHGEIMAMGIPVITNSGVGDVKEIVENYKSGYIVNNFTAEEYEAVINKMDHAKFDKVIIREAAIEYYSLTNAINQYKKIYQEIL